MPTTSHEFNDLSGWSISEGSWTSTGTAAKLTNSNGWMRLTGAGQRADLSDQWAHVELDSYFITNAQWSGPGIRMASGIETFYMSAWEQVSGTNQKRLYKAVSGTFTQLASSDEATFTDGQTLAVRATGTTVKAYLDGNQFANVTDSEVTAGDWGVYGKASGGTTRHWTWERFEASDAPEPTGGGPPVFQHNYRRRRVS